MSKIDYRQMFYGAKPKVFELAKQNRKNPTITEALLWEKLKNSQLGVRFKRQHPADRFILDFYCHKLKLAIEIDGGYHLSKEQQEYDEGRTFHLNEFGIKVIRFKNEDILEQLEYVISKIEREVKGLIK